MKIAGIIARLLLGLMFTVFGLNGFLHFIKQPPPSGLALQYMGVLGQAGFFPIVFGDQLLCGLLLLSGFFVPLALVLLGPVLAHILLFHTLMAPAGIGPGALAFVLWLIVFFSERASFAPLFRPKPLPASAPVYR